MSAWVIIILRTVFIAGLILSGDVLALLYAWVECVTVGFAIGNELKRVERDDRPVGVWVPLAYAVGLLIVPKGSSGPWLQSCMALIVFLTCWAVWWLGTAYSLGRSSWVRLVDGGPYSVVRHPIYALNLAARWVFVLGNLSVDNVGASVVFTGMLIFAVHVEEGFLRSQLPWSVYADRVKWRLLPGVW